MQGEDQRLLRARGILDECFNQMRFARATELALANRFFEAEALLAPRGRLPERPRELDLLARMAAKQMHFKQARHCWEEAQRKEPTNIIYHDAIKSLEEIQQAAAGQRKIALVCLAIGSAVAVAAILLVFWPRHRAIPTNSVVQHVQTMATPTKPPGPAVSPIIVFPNLPSNGASQKR